MTTSKALFVASRLSKGLTRKNAKLRTTARFFSSDSTTTRHLSSARPLAVEEEEEPWLAPQLQQSLSIESPSSPVQSPPLSLPKEETNKEATFTSPSELVFTGNHVIPITSTLHIVTPDEDTPRGTWPIFRLMDENGRFRDSHRHSFSKPRRLTQLNDANLDSLRLHLQKHYPHFSQEFNKSPLLTEALYDYMDMPSQKTNTLLRAHRQMIRLKEMDTILQNAQRQGRISFYMTCRGEEAIHIGTAAALEREDTILAQYREAGLLMWRGFTLEQFTNQCFSNDHDLGKGRQMPVHYTSRALNYHTISSPLGTQLPQAVGAAYHFKLQNQKNVAACFFGEGAASTTDFHSACNFAATLKVPVLFLCRNNGYAISTPVKDQYAGDGIVSRAPGYGMAGVRVDGNDVFAVSAAVREAKAYALENSAPVMVEFMTYRQGHHSTSDDSTRYRQENEVEAHRQHGDPLERLGAFLEIVGVSPQDIRAMRDEEKLAVLQAMEQAEKRPDPPLSALFEDVYDEKPLHLQRQEEQLHEHMSKYPKHYQSLH